MAPGSKRALLGFVRVAATLLLLVVLLVAYDVIATHIAKSKAETACDSIVTGMTQQTVNRIFSRLEVEPRLRNDHPEGDLISVGFSGATPLDRWMCIIRLSEGKVVSKEVRLID